MRVRVFLCVSFVVSYAVASPARLTNPNNATTVIAILTFILNLRKFDLRSGRADQRLGYPSEVSPAHLGAERSLRVRQRPSPDLVIAFLVLNVAGSFRKT